MLPLRELREHERVFVVGSKDSDMAVDERIACDSVPITCDWNPHKM
jgi:hypothetical protein